MDTKELMLKANDIRKDIVKMLAEAGSGHSGGSLGLTDIFAALYFDVMKHDPKKPDWEGRDIFILSNGHVAPVLYATMANAGYFPKEELMTLRKYKTRLQGHPHRLYLPGVELTAGSLGQGLTVAVGMAKAFRMDSKDNTVYCSMGDGELQEGSIWEGFMFAAHNRLDNLIGFIDRNYLQIDGNTEDVMSLDPLDKKLESFNWQVVEADGHVMEDILRAFKEAKDLAKKNKRPAAIIFRTTMGKGVSFMEDKYEWHGKPPSKEEEEIALKELDEARKSIGGEK